METGPDPAATRQQQIQLYGEPLADVIGTISNALGLNQAEIAQILGLSAPMLSHLANARRVKIGNPVAGARLSQLRGLAAAVRDGLVTRGDLPTQLNRIAHSTDNWTTEISAATQYSQARNTGGAREVQELFRAVAAATDWLDVADQIAAEHPEISHVLRIYGAGRADAAEAHWSKTLSTVGGR